MTLKFFITHNNKSYSRINFIKLNTYVVEKY